MTEPDSAQATAPTGNPAGAMTAGTYSILVGCALLLSLLGLLRWLVEGHITGDVLRRHLAESPQG